MLDSRVGMRPPWNVARNYFSYTNCCLFVTQQTATYLYLTDNQIERLFNLGYHKTPPYTTNKSTPQLACFISNCVRFLNGLNLAILYVRIKSKRSLYYNMYTFSLYYIGLSFQLFSFCKYTNVFTKYEKLHLVFYSCGIKRRKISTATWKETI